MYETRSWYTKPPLGIQLNRGHPLAYGLVARWLFNEGCGAYIFDLTGRNHTVTLNGSTLPSWKTGKFGVAVDFGGSVDYGTAGNILELDGAASATMSGWFYKSGASDTVGMGKYIEPYRFSVIWYTDNKFYTNLDTGTLAAYVNTGAIANYGWHHYAAVFDGSLSGSAKLAIYFDGVLQSNAGSSGTLPTTITATAREWRFGMDNSVGNRNWGGRIDNVALYNRALTKYEIVWLYREPFADCLPLQTRRYFLLNQAAAAGGFQPAWGTKATHVVGGAF